MTPPDRAALIRLMAEAIAKRAGHTSGMSFFQADAKAALAALEAAGCRIETNEPTRAQWAAAGDALCAFPPRRKPQRHHDLITKTVLDAIRSVSPYAPEPHDEQ